MTTQDDVMRNADEWRNECDNWIQYSAVHGTIKTIEDMVIALQTARRVMFQMQKQLEMIKKTVE